jgi:seryl-tRNA synthetase
MLDIVVIRRDPDRVRRSLQRRGLDPSVVDEVLQLDAEYRSALAAAQNQQAARKELSARIGRAQDKAAATSELRPQLDAIAAEIAKHEERARALAPDAEGSALRVLLEQMPNLLDDSVPEGSGDENNVTIRSFGSLPRFDFPPRPHWELGERLDILDFERAAKLSGSRFSLMRGRGARLSRALAQFFLDRATARGYVEIAPPYLMMRTTMWKTGQLSKFADAMFRDADTDLFLIPTAEVPLTALHGDEILEAQTLPRKYVAYTPCFRKEAGAAGKDTRGLVRQHQFDKVELVLLCDPQRSFEMLERLLSDAAALLEELGLPHRIVAVCAGDVGFNGAKQYDIEVWVPSANTYREISSCSNCTDFQARRAGIRFRGDGTRKPEPVHTLNGSALAVGRTMLAIMENFQRKDGSIAVPEALQPYTGFQTLEPETGF